jgi:hypothetical protein
VSPISRKVREQTGRDTLHRNATQCTAMPPKRELSIRLRADLRGALDAAVAERGQTLTAIVEDALTAHLGVDGPEPGQATLADRVRALEERVGLLEGTAMQRNAPPRSTPPHTAPATGLASTEAAPSGEGLSLGEALIAAGAPITPSVARSTNRARAMRTATGMAPAAWLESRGWVKAGDWYPPD